MIVIVCGSRTWTDAEVIERRLALLPEGTEIVHGGAIGADLIAADCAERLGLPVREFPADWQRYGKAAGPIRNVEMLKVEPDLVLAFWKDGSRGTRHMVVMAETRRVPMEVIRG